MLPKAFALSLQSLTLALLLMSVVVLYTACFVDGQANFTQVPPSKLYVSSGTNATFVWKYDVVDRILDFDVESPKWSFFDKQGGGHVIGKEVRPNGWKWQIVNSTCPPRLLKPIVRVWKESTATLIISDVTTADNGTYGCTLVLKSPPSEVSKVQLIVTVHPQIHTARERIVTEYENLTLSCSADGPPTPNITWIRRENGKDVVKSRGIQLATFSIVNITKDQAGTYTCIATNNPNEQQVQENITVYVKYPPVLDENMSSNKLEPCPGKKANLTCVANGFPAPNYTWNGPSRVPWPEAHQSILTIDEVTKIHDGNWTCYITNGIGPGINHTVQLKVLDKTHPKCESDDEYDGLTTPEIIGIIIGVLVLVGIIVVIPVIICKKDDDDGLTTAEIIGIVIGVLVLVGIIAIVAVIIYKKDDDGLTTGEIIGIIIGVLVFVGIIVVIPVIICKKEKRAIQQDIKLEKQPEQ